MSNFEPQKRRTQYREYNRKTSKYHENDGTTIERSIEMIGEGDSVVKDIERIVDSLEHEILYHKKIICGTVYRLMFQKPEMISTYVSLIGLLHVKESEFGSDFLFFLTDKINYHFQNNDYIKLKYLIRFTCDMVNVNVISVKCILNLFEKMLVTARDHSTSMVYSNWLLYTIIISVPWMANKADTSSEYGQHFDQYLAELTDFYSKYDQNLYKPFRIWSVTDSPFVQKDYMLCAWENMQKLKADDWKWVGVTKPYETAKEFKKAVKLTLPTIMLPSSSEMYNMPCPSVLTQIFIQCDILEDGSCGSDLLPLGSQLRYQVEEQIEAILLTHETDRKECVGRLIGLTKFTKYAIPYVIVEYLFQNILALSSQSIPDIYCCVVLCLLCNVSSSLYPIIINKICNLLISSCDYMNVVCIKKLADFFSHYIANNRGNWNWDDLEYINDLAVTDFRKLFLQETFRKLQNHYDGKFNVDEQFNGFNKLLDFDRECNYYYGEKSKSPESLIEIKNVFISKIVAKATCDELFNVLDSSLNNYKGEPPFEFEDLSTKNIIQIHLTIQTLLAAFRHILSKTFTMIESHKLLLERLVGNEQQEIVLLYSVYQFWFKNPLRIKIVFFYLWQQQLVQPCSIIKFLLHDKLIGHLNKFYVWEIIDELLTFYINKDIVFQFNSLKNGDQKPVKGRKKYPRIKAANSDDDDDDDNASTDHDMSYEDSLGDNTPFDTVGVRRNKNLETLKQLLLVCFERLCAIIAHLDRQSQNQGGVNSTTSSSVPKKLCFNISQYFQNILLKNYHWFKLIDVNEVFEQYNYGTINNLSTIFSRFVALTS